MVSIQVLIIFILVKLDQMGFLSKELQNKFIMIIVKKVSREAVTYLIWAWELLVMVLRDMGQDK
jgi:hypothetical protein